MRRSPKLLRLLCDFAKMGCCTFGGGWSLIAQMQRLFVEQRKSITSEELLDLTSVAKSLPGVMIGHTAVLYGYREAGAAGALAAACFQKFKSSSFLQRAMVGIRPVCTAMVLGVLVGMLRSNYRFADRFDAAAAAISVLDMVPILRYKWSAARVLGISAALGLLLFGVLGW